MPRSPNAPGSSGSPARAPMAMHIPVKMAAKPMASISNAPAKTIVAEAKAKAIPLPPRPAPKKPAFVTSYNPTGPGAAIAQTATFKAAVAAGLVAPPIPAAVPDSGYSANDAGSGSGGAGSSDDGQGQYQDAAPDASQNTAPDTSDDAPTDRAAQLAALYAGSGDGDPSPQEQTQDDGITSGFYTSDDEDAEDAAFEHAVNNGAGSAQQASNYPGRTDDTEFVPAQSFDDESGEGSPDVNGDAVTGLHCYVSRGKLTCMGLVKTQHGNLPIVTHIRVPKDTPDGPIDISGEGDSDVGATVFGDMIANADYETIRRDSEDQVIRAREGDENAMGTIRAVREAAKAGSPRARAAHGVISAYIEAHPVRDGSDPIGFEPLPPFETQSLRAAVRLANGPRIDADRYQDMVRSYAKGSGRAARIVQFGAENFQCEKDLAEAKAKLASHAEAALLELGKIIGHALAIQKVREPGTPVSVLSQEAAWELGED